MIVGYAQCHVLREVFMQEDIASNADFEKMTNEQLVVFAKDGDEKSFRILLERLQDVIKSSVSLYLDQSVESEDMFQEANIAFLSAVRRYDPEKNASFRTFAAVCINNRLVNFIKSRSSKKLVSRFGFSDIDDPSNELREDSETPGPEEDLINREQNALLVKFIKDLLSPLEYDVLTFILEGESYEQTASVLGLNVKSVDNAMQRVRKKMRNILG